MRIMIVDDNELMRKEISKSVAFLADTILECYDGEHAVLSCVDFMPDWILMDIKMPTMNGITAAEKIKGIIPHVKIAFVTSYDNPYFRRAADSIGVEHYFLKTNLLEIRKVLDDSQG
ncbi:MAG: DNA-binding response regulator [Stygiobacter sp.]|nr:MAG: DNA-binding response regulator [Stygiobacter sp.]